MDLNGVERIDVHALGGTDNVVVNDVTGTDLQAVGVLVDLAGTLGGSVGDGQVDTVTANGTAGNDAIRLFSFNGGDFNGGIGILGTPAGVVVTHQDATDQLTVNGGAGNDVIDASAAGCRRHGADHQWRRRQRHDHRQPGRRPRCYGGDGNDALIGGRGNDVALLGAGDDTFVWNPGDGSDTVEGQAGSDTLVFNGANVNENIDISANGGRVRLHPRRRHRRHGPQRRRADRRPRPRRRRQHRGQRCHRDRSPGCRSAGRPCRHARRQRGRRSGSTR